MNLSGKVYSKTGKGVQALSSKSRDLSSDSLKILASIDGKTDAETLMEQFVKLPDEAFMTMISQLEADGYIRFVKNKDWDIDDDDIGASTAMVVDELSPEDFFALSNQATPETKISLIVEPEPAAAKENEAKVSPSPPSKSKADKKAGRSVAKVDQAQHDVETLAETEEKARQEAEYKAREEVAKQAREAEEARKRAEAEVIAKAEQVAKQAAERLAREKDEARQKAEAEARAIAETEARLEAERVAREAEARQQAEAEKRAKAEHEAKLEAERLAKEEAERQARKDEEARQKAEAEARIKAEKEARLEAQRVAKEEAKRKADEDKALRQKAKEAERAIAAELAREKAEQKAREKAERNAEKEAQRAMRPPFDWSKWFLIAKKSIIYSPLIIIFLLGLLHVVNLSMLAGPIEKRLSEMMSEPVKIDKVRISLFPMARLTLSDIAVGIDKELDIDLVKMSPAVLMQSAEIKHIKMLEIVGVVVHGKSVANQLKWLQALTDKNKLSLEEIAIKEITLRIPGLELDQFNANVVVPAAGGFNAITLQNSDRSLRIKLAPSQNDTYRVTINANAWQPPFASHLQFTELKAEGLADSQQIHLDRIVGEIYSGSLEADLTINWSAQAKASGNFVINDLSLPVAFSSIKSAASVDGTLNAKGAFLSKTDLVGKLMDALVLNATFTALNGKINDVDLAAKMISSANRQDGVTRFDKLSGSLQFQDGQYQFRQLLLNSGQFKARGNLDIQSNQEVTGKVAGELVTPSRVIRSNLNISGKVGSVKVN